MTSCLSPFCVLFSPSQVSTHLGICSLVCFSQTLFLTQVLHHLAVYLALYMCHFRGLRLSFRLLPLIAWIIYHYIKFHTSNCWRYSVYITVFVLNTISKVLCKIFSDVDKKSIHQFGFNCIFCYCFLLEGLQWTNTSIYLHFCGFSVHFPKFLCSRCFLKLLLPVFCLSFSHHGGDLISYFFIFFP